MVFGSTRLKLFKKKNPLIPKWLNRSLCCCLPVSHFPFPIPIPKTLNRSTLDSLSSLLRICGAASLTQNPRPPSSLRRLIGRRFEPSTVDHLRFVFDSRRISTQSPAPHPSPLLSSICLRLHRTVAAKPEPTRPPPLAQFFDGHGE